MKKRYWILGLGMMVALAGCAKQTTPTAPASSQAEPAKKETEPMKTEPATAPKEPNVEETPKPPARPVVIMETSMGTITIELNAEKAPKTVANFLRYADEKFYDGTIFHRVISGFMVQGGGFTPQMRQKATHDEIENEAANGLKNLRGAIAMARTPNPHSASSQFFINHKDNEFLNFTAPTARGYGYCVFGKVLEGMDVVDKIAAVKTGQAGPHGDVPAETILIRSVRRKGME
jgi:peptidyl-prolyl cis-trans isomerase B (cyclophilin B)